MPVLNANGEKIYLADYTWDELAARPDRESLIFVLTLGATEQHGYHLPMGTDTLQAVRVAEEAARRVPGVVLLPAVPYGYCLDTMSYCGTVTLSASTLIGLIGDVAESLRRHGFRKFVIFSGHGGNKGVADVGVRDALQRLAGPAGQIPRDFSIYLVNAFEKISPQVRALQEGRDYGHSCEMETSLMLVLDPQTVKMEKAVEEYMDGDPDTLWRVRDMKTASMSGVHGAATLGTREKGEKLFQLLIEDLEGFLRRI